MPIDGYALELTPAGRLELQFEADHVAVLSQAECRLHSQPPHRSRILTRSQHT